MDKATEMSIAELIVIPLIREMMGRRGVTGVKHTHVAVFLEKLPDMIIPVLKRDPELRAEVINDLVDAIDSVAGGIGDAVVKLFSAVMVDAENRGEITHNG